MCTDRQSEGGRCKIQRWAARGRSSLSGARGAQLLSGPANLPARGHGITGFTDAEGEPRFRQLGRDQSTVATWLDDAGYQTKYLGKYLNGYRGPYVPPGWDEWFALHGGQVNNEVNDDGRLVSLTGTSADA